MSGTFPRDGEWLGFRRDAAQTGRSPLKGKITNPEIAWEHFAGINESLVELRPGKDKSSVRVPVTGGQAAEAVLKDPRWGLQPPLGLIEGKLQPQQRKTPKKYCDTLYLNICPELEGLEKVTFQSGHDQPLINGKYQASVVEALAWKDGRWQRLWYGGEFAKVFSPQTVAEDFDGDGNTEIAFLPWDELVVLDAKSGKVKDRCRFTEGRSYGAMGTWDLDGDGKSELLVHGNYASKHVDAFCFRGDRLELLWRWSLEQPSNDQSEFLHVLNDPVAEVDGDGKLELMVNLYDGAHDARWHTKAVDALTGTVKVDLTGEYMAGIVDVDGDGVAEILTIATDGRYFPECGTIRIWSLRDGRARKIWEAQGAAWQMWQPPQPLHINKTLIYEMDEDEVLWRNVNGKVVLVLRRPDEKMPGNAVLSLESWDGGGLEPMGPSISGPRLRGVSLDEEDGAMLVSCETSVGNTAVLQASGGSCEVLATRHKTVYYGHARVVQEESARPVIIADVCDQEVVALEAPQGRKGAQELWRTPGWGQMWGNTMEHTRYGLLLADLRGDGRRQMIYSTGSPEDIARLVAGDLNGHELWHHDLPPFPGRPHDPKHGGFCCWQAGRFVSKDRVDVLVSTMRSQPMSSEIKLLSGKDGSVIWHIEIPLRDVNEGRDGIGTVPFVVADLDGDGLDDVAYLFMWAFRALKGATGKPLFEPLNTLNPDNWKEVPGWHEIYVGMLVAGDFLADGTTTLFAGSRTGFMTGVLHKDGQVAWWHERGTTPRYQPAIGDFSGSGRLEIMGAGYPDGIRLYDGATGQVKWHMPMPVQCDVMTDLVDATSGDVDSDGRDEALFVIKRTLYCVGCDADGKSGKVKWQIKLPIDVGPPTIADVDGSGQASILLVGGDGTVYCIAQRRG